MKTLERLKVDWVMATEIHKLEARLWRIAQREGLQVILLTSGARGDGKSTTVAYLATALGQYPDRRVLAIDLDLRQPQLAEYLGVEVRVGIGEVIRGRATPDEAVVATSLPSLDLLSSPKGGTDPNALLRTRELYTVFQWVKQTYDLAIVDAPALMPVADTSIVIPLVDGVVLTAMAGKTTKYQLRQAREQCLGMGAKLLGLVVGNLREAVPEYGGWDSYYSYKPSGDEPSNGDRPPIEAMDS